MLAKFGNLSWLYAYYAIDKTDMPTRRFDLDWLRVAVFGLLIFFHTGMFYVQNWGWHVKSTYLSQSLESLMLLVEPWRMAVLWLIAGISIRFILAKVSVWRFVGMRSFRLLLPLLFGVLVVVPPQLYVEMTHNGDLNMSYWQFLLEFFSKDSAVFNDYQAGIWPHMDVNHLWFIRSLWQYSLAILCLLPLLNANFLTRITQWLFKQHGALALFLATLPLYLIEIFWQINPVRYPIGFTLMMYGFLIAWQPSFWQRLAKSLKPLVYLFISSYLALVLFYNTVWLDIISEQAKVSEWLLMLGKFNYSLNRVLGALLVFAIAYRFFNRPSKQLRYFNEGVYPFYILHQTFIVVFGFQLSKWQLGTLLEPVLLMVATVLACFVGFEVIRRTDMLRPLFGLKMNHSYQLLWQRLGYSVSSVLMFTIAWQILR